MPAKASSQPTMMLTDTPLSLASQLLQGTVPKLENEVASKPVNAKKKADKSVGLFNG